MTSLFKRAALVAAALGLAVAPAFAAMEGDNAPTPSTTIGDLVITNAVARETAPAAQVGAGYLTIENTGETDDVLLSATSSISPDIQIHEMRMDGDVMRMRELSDGLVIPADETVVLEPGGVHLMFMALEDGFAEGASLPMELTFQQAGAVAIELDVRAHAGANQGDH